MWSNFLMQEEDRRRGASGQRARGQHKSGLSPEQEGKIKLALLLTAVGATLAVLAVGTEFWVELNTFKANDSAVCDAAHLGLWKMCTKRLWQADVPVGRETCGPAALPGGEAAPRAWTRQRESPGGRKLCPRNSLCCRESLSPREGAYTLRKSPNLHQPTLCNSLFSGHEPYRKSVTLD